jgi:hypothetical protein
VVVVRERTATEGERAVSDHPWCRDVARDEAVRAAEDAVERPAVPEWREIPERVAALEREVAAMRVPVVPAAEGEAEVERLRAERDAAIRERDAALARVAEFEEQAKLAPAPNVGDGSNQADAEPMAWGVVARQTNEIPPGCAQSQAKNFALKTGGTVVPLYRSPPPPRGWLTEEEREAVEAVKDAAGKTLLCKDCCRTVEHAESLLRRLEVIRALISRNSPPKVKLPAAVYLEHEWLAALAAAGVEVEE